MSPAQPAYATPAPPPNDPGYYILSTDPSHAYNAGCADGTWDANHGKPDRLTYLDFGGQLSDGSGTKLINGTNVGNGRIESIAENYALGYYYCTGSDTTSIDWLAVGTNNSLSDISSSGGATWAKVVSAVQNSTDGKIAAPQVVYWGANDIEAWYASTTNTAVENWASGWHNTTTRLYVNYGSADGCSTSSYTSGKGYDCSTATSTGTNKYFYQYDYWWLSWGLSNALSLPEIYVSGNAHQWTELCLYGRVEKGKEIFFEGPLNNYTLDSSDLSPSAAWSDFWNDLNATSCAQTPSFMEATRRET